LYAPGFDFWEEGDTESICSTVNTECVVEYEKKLGSSKKCVENCHCLSASWEDEMNEVCISLGDCGISVNYIEVEGYND
jgi:hypothetical protein